MRRRPTSSSRPSGQDHPLVDGPQDIADAQGKFLPKLVSRHLPRAALEQAGAHLCLQFLDLHGQSGWEMAACLGSVAEVAVTGESVEIAELTDCEVLHQINLSR